MFATVENMIIFSGEKIDSDEVVEGYCYEYKTYKGNRQYIKDTNDIERNYQIKPSTLKVSFDGKVFYTESFINACIDQTKRRDNRSCGNCDWYIDNQCEIIDKYIGEEHYCSLWKELDND